jgi:hypothetical protein
MNVALIIGRKGSEGFPGKNTLSILERPLCAYPIMAAKHAWYVSDVFVSTNDEKLIDIAREHECEVIHRPDELCRRETTQVEAFVHGYNEIKNIAAKRGEEIELVVLQYCNAATILAETIDEGIEKLWEHPEYDSAVTVSCFNMWNPVKAKRIASDGLLVPFANPVTGDPADKKTKGNPSVDDAWFMDMGAAIVRPHCIETLQPGGPEAYLGKRVYPIKTRAGMDIDYSWQVPCLKFWLKEHGFTETSTPYER